jgi:pyruvate/2-oxoglutarate dehydrogenase complex dihydrolipoamide dehydrogenase (E3) component
MEEPGADFILFEKDIVTIGGGPAGYVALIHATHPGINDFQRRVRGKKHNIGKQSNGI